MEIGSLLVSVLCFGLSLTLMVLSAWFRWGASGIARWWVRRIPVERTSFASSASEGLALGVTPYLGQMMGVVGVVALLHVHPTIRELLFEPVMWTAVSGEVVLGIVVLVLVSNRRLLPLLFYPAWLRPQRRAERAFLRAG